MTTITVIVDNTADQPWHAEHGLSLGIEYGKELLLFDTGAGEALEPNLQLAELTSAKFTHILLSHGHNDHTGGLETALRLYPHAQVVYGRGALSMRYSLHEGRPPHCLQMPRHCVRALASAESQREITSVSEILPGCFVIAPIPRLSGEDCGGPFYFDLEGREPDPISDELALLLADGTLIQGCCHSGIINTLETCHKELPDIRIRRIIGGLHLVHASAQRIKQTADYLNEQHLENLVLLHCTGAEAMEYLCQHLHCQVVCGQAGDVFHG